MLAFVSGSQALLSVYLPLEVEPDSGLDGCAPSTPEDHASSLAPARCPAISSGSSSPQVGYDFSHASAMCHHLPAPRSVWRRRVSALGSVEGQSGGVSQERPKSGGSVGQKFAARFFFPRWVGVEGPRSSPKSAVPNSLREGASALGFRRRGTSRGSRLRGCRVDWFHELKIGSLENMEQCQCTVSVQYQCSTALVPV